MRNITLLQGRLESFGCTNAEEESNAIREMMQELILAGLARSNFFVKAAFHGGTQLRIFEGVRRFSEDLDFALLEKDLSFPLLPSLERVAEELSTIGVELEVKDRSKADAAVKKGFVKNSSLAKILDLKFMLPFGSPSTPPKMTIKLEVDADPPAGARYSAKQLFFPYPASIRCFDRESSFSGKMHALLCREYVKGRDWFDFVWYAGTHTRLNHELLSSAINQQGPWAGQGIVTDDAWVKAALCGKIASLDWKAAQRDVMPFVQAGDRMAIEAWDAQYFSAIAEELFNRPTGMSMTK